MKYYLTYLNEEGESTKIELSNLPFFKDKSAGKILNIIAFYKLPNNFPIAFISISY